MATTFRITTTTLSLLLLVFSPTLAQDEKSARPQPVTTIVTANANLDKVRFAAPGNNMQLRLEVYAISGDRVFDVEMKRGNVLDWTLQDQMGQRLSDGEYLCVVTVKALTGKLTQRIGLIAIQQQQVAMRQADAAQLSSAQTQALGPVEADSGMTVLEDNKARALTVVAHTGREGELISTRGDLSFRVGDFFSGKDKEQMRLTEDGRLGIGTSNPQATLDVAGTIRASKGIEFADGTVQTTALAARKDKDDNIVASSTGTQNKVAKWLDNIGTLGDSALTETAGNVGIGTDAPASLLHLAGPDGVSAITLNTPGSHRYRFQTVPGVPNWGGLTLNANYNAGWRLDDPTTNGWFFKLDTRGGDAAGPNNGLWLYRVPAGPNPHTDEAPMFGVTNGQAYFAGNLGIGTTNPAAKLDVVGDTKVSNNLTVDTNTLFVNAANDRVGIGTTTPGRALDVVTGVGDGVRISTGGNLFFRNASNSTDVRGMGMDESGNLYVGGAADMGILVLHSGTPSAERLRIESNGNVGIGTPIPTAKLDVAGDTKVSSNLTVDTNTLFVNAANDRVGIRTTAPSAALQVRNTPFDTGNATFFNNAGAMFATASNNGGSNPAESEPALVLAREGISGDAFANFARFDLKRYENADHASRTQLDIGLTHNDLFGEANSTPTIMSLRSNGNVGIGNTNPKAALDINGDIKARNLPGVQFSQGSGAPTGGDETDTFVEGERKGIDELSIFVPTSGFIIITAYATVLLEPTAGASLFFFILQDLTGTPVNLTSSRLSKAGGGEHGTLHLSWVLEVTDPTPHNVHLKTLGFMRDELYGSPQAIRYAHNLTALFVANRY